MWCESQWCETLSIVLFSAWDFLHADTHSPTERILAYQLCGTVEINAEAPCRCWSHAQLQHS